jgi:hypothetical protein
MEPGWRGRVSPWKPQPLRGWGSRIFPEGSRERGIMHNSLKQGDLKGLPENHRIMMIYITEPNTMG